MSYRFRSNQQTKEEVIETILKRMGEDSSITIRTVGELVDALAKFDRGLPVIFTHHVSDFTDGTDMGYDEDCGIEAVSDLETRIVIEADASIRGWKN